MSDFINVTLLSLLQGVAEFLPISSSGHLVIGQHFLGVEESGVRLETFLHVGTLVSVFAFYRQVIWRILAGREWEYVAKLIVSCIPAILVYFLFKDAIESVFENAKAVGALLVFTGLVLTGTKFMASGKKEVSFGKAVWMGAMQALALLPGVSRSGMTLVAARSGGVAAEKSAEFSFLMSAPLIMGGMMLEIVKMFTAKGPAPETELGWGVVIYGAILAAIVGYVSLALLVKSLKGSKFWLFGPYCIVAGIVTVVFT